MTNVRVTRADPATDRAAIRRVREVVFVGEQGVPRDLEDDGADARCVHVLARDPTGAPIGTGRLAPDGRIGRMAVLPDWRGRGVGAALLRALLEEARAAGHAESHLHAQVGVVDFYQRQGFVAEGAPFREAGIMHRLMRRPLP